MRNCGGVRRAHAHALPLRAFGRRGRGDRATSPRDSASNAWRSSATPWAATWCSSWPASGAARPPLVAVATVCPAIDLAAGADALHEPANRIYEWRFLRGPDAPVSPQGAALSRPSTSPGGIGPIRSIREFDEKIVARYCGFRDCRRLLLPRRQRPRRRSHRSSHAHPLRTGRSVHPALAETRARMTANPHIVFAETAPRWPLRVPGLWCRRRNSLGRGGGGPLHCRCRIGIHQRVELHTSASDLKLE